MPGPTEPTVDDYYDYEDHCSHWVECDDPIQCCAEHNGDPFAGGEHRCPACGGTGLASKQVLW